MQTDQTRPSPAAMRAAEKVSVYIMQAGGGYVLADIARIIDRETGAAELRATLEGICNWIGPYSTSAELNTILNAANAALRKVA